MISAISNQGISMAATTLRRSSYARVSVVIPIYNKAPYLSQCLESVSDQSLKDIEIICIDDCSTDTSFDIAIEHSKRDPRVVLFRNDTNNGPGFVRNLGIAKASAPFVQFTDADDVLPRHALEALFELATKDGVPVVRGSLGNFSGTTDNIWFDDSQLMPDRHEFRLKEEKKLWIPYFHVCYLFSKAFLAANNISYPSLRSGEDPVFLAQCLVNTPFISTTSETTYLYRRSATYNRTTCADVLDFICHVKRLKDIYTHSQNTQCWFDCCEQFYLEDTKAFVKKVPLSQKDCAQIIRAMREIWHLSSDALEF